MARTKKTTTKDGWTRLEFVVGADVITKPLGRRVVNIHFPIMKPDKYLVYDESKSGRGPSMKVGEARTLTEAKRIGDRYIRRATTAL